MPRKKSSDESTDKKTTKKTQASGKDEVKDIEVNLEVSGSEDASAEEAGNESETPQKLSEKVLYTDIDEEITSVIDRIKKIQADKVYLVLPTRAVILQSIVNLKILAHEAEKLDKELALVTSDRKGGSLASQVGLSVYQDLHATGLQGTRNLESKPTIPIKATVEKSKVKKPTLKSNKKSIQDFVKSDRTEVNSYSAGFSVKKVAEKIMPKSKSPDGSQVMDTAAFMGGAPNKRVIGLFVVVSIVVLLLIAYFVLPKAEVIVEMESQTQTPLERVVLADSVANEAELRVYNDNIIGSYPIETEIELTKQYAASGYQSQGTDSRGEVIIFNDSATPQGLIETTRLRSPEGIIYRIQNDVFVPAGGTITVSVVADKVDEAGQIVGERGNIGPSRFSIPGLTGSNKDLIYGKSIEPFYGGTTAAVKLVTEEDINAAREDIIVKLKDSARGKLIDRISSQNAAENTHFWLLENDDALEISVITNDVLDGVKAGDIRDNFEVYAKITVSGVMFDRQEMIQILDRKLRADLHPDMRIAYADENSLSMDFVEYDEAEEKIRLNVSMSYRLEYELSDTLQATIKNKIVGQSSTSAREYLQGLPEIGEVRITTWPFWVNSIPGVTGNIEIIKKSAE